MHLLFNKFNNDLFNVFINILGIYLTFILISPNINLTFQERILLINIKSTFIEIRYNILRISFDINLNSHTSSVLLKLM